MTTLFTATAANSFFFANLAVRANSLLDAEKAFEDYVVSMQSTADEEFEMALALYPDADRDDYAYGLVDKIAERDEDAHVSGYLGEIFTAVVMTSSGGNG